MSHRRRGARTLRLLRGPGGAGILGCVRTRGGRGRAAGAMVIALCGVGGGAGSAGAADRVVTTGVGHSIQAFLGTFAWEEPTASGLGSRLVLFSRGRRRFAPVRPFSSTGPPALSLGPGRHGVRLAAYNRCNSHGFCDLFALGLHSGREHKLRALSSRRWSEDAVAVWGRRYLFTRGCGTASCRRGDGLFLAPPLRRLTARSVDGFDLRRRVAALISSRGVEPSDLIRVGYLSRRGRMRTCRVAAAPRVLGGVGGITLSSPVVTKRFVYWVAAPNEAAGPVAFFRRRTPSRHCAQRGHVERLRQEPSGYEIAVTRGRVFYTANAPKSGQPALFEMTDPPVRHP